jgi:hypothetical protein
VANEISHTVSVISTVSQPADTTPPMLSTISTIDENYAPVATFHQHSLRLLHLHLNLWMMLVVLQQLNVV